MNQANDMVLTLITPARAYELGATRISETCRDTSCPVKASVHHHATGRDGRPFAVMGA